MFVWREEGSDSNEDDSGEEEEDGEEEEYYDEDDYVPHKLSVEQHDVFKQAFEMFDRNQSGMSW